MPIPVHLICGKCGSLDIMFRIDKPDEESCGVVIVCKNCSELTSVECINEWKEEPKKKKTS